MPIRSWFATSVLTDHIKTKRESPAIFYSDIPALLSFHSMIRSLFSSIVQVMSVSSGLKSHFDPTHWRYLYTERWIRYSHLVNKTKLKTPKSRRGRILYISTCSTASPALKKQETCTRREYLSACLINTYNHGDAYHIALLFVTAHLPSSLGTTLYWNYTGWYSYLARFCPLSQLFIYTQYQVNLSPELDLSTILTTSTILPLLY